MGVIHKLKPEVLNFILENKQNNPALSCRHLTSLIFEQLHIKVSKSSINAVFKENDLSMPIGRRRKEKKKKFKMPVLPIIEETKTSRLGNIPQDIARDLEEEKLAEEKAAQEVARIKALEEAKLLDLEKAAKEAEEKRKVEEEARKQEEEKAAEEAEEKRKIQEEARKLAEEKAAQEVARIKAQEEVRLKELEETAAELAKLKTLEEARLKELEKLTQEAAETKRKQEEALRQEEEKAAQEVARIKALEEAKLRDLEKAAKEAEEKRRVEEEARKQEEEKAALELAKLKAQEEARLKELERLAALAAESRKLAEEKAAQEAELKAERERWVRIAQEEEKAKQKESIPEIPAPQLEPAVAEILPEDRVCSGAVLLKALDSLIGASKEINALISRATGKAPEDSLQLTEALIFKSLFAKDTYSTLGDLIGVRYSQEKLNSYYAQVKLITEIGLDIAKIISNVFTEAKGIKLHFTDESIIYLDGKLYSSWPGTRFPYDFSNTSLALKNNLNDSFLRGEPLVLFSPPGYDIFPKDFFTLLSNFMAKDKRPDRLALFGNQLEELDTLSINQQNSYSLIFGLWPWQFTSSRKVKKIGDFALKYIKEIDRDLYLGEIEIDLFRASLNQSVTLKGCAVKTDLKEKIRLVILNSAETPLALDELAGIYLGRWPNFEEAFQDFSRKIELFTYAGNEQGFFPKDSFGMDTAGVTMEPAGIFANYLKMLDAYLRWHFLPNEYRDKDLSSTSDCFYKIPAKLIAGENRVRVKTLVSQEYQFLKDLEYLNCRLNERQLNKPDGKRFWFESAFK
jgi:hypothetical protein